MLFDFHHFDVFSLQIFLTVVLLLPQSQELLLLLVSQLLQAFIFLTAWTWASDGDIKRYTSVYTSVHLITLWMESRKSHFPPQSIQIYCRLSDSFLIPALAALSGRLLILVVDLSEELRRFLLMSSHQLLQLFKLTLLLLLVNLWLLETLQCNNWNVWYISDHRAYFIQLQESSFFLSF